MLKDKIIKPKRIKIGDTVGIFTPSTPANVLFKEKYLHAISELKRIGFNVIEGDLTKKSVKQGYRSGNPKERAQEFMDLIENQNVDFLMSTIGGYNSSSLIPYLDFDIIKKNRKIITGYSDITSLHMAILTQSNLSTFYGPAVVPTFGEWPHAFSESVESFLTLGTSIHLRNYKQPFFEKWSNHFRNAFTDEWKSVERKYEFNSGYKIISSGVIEAPIIIANLNTLCSLAGTSYFPDFCDNILLIEEECADFAEEERSLTQLKLMGVFENIKGLIVSKPEFLNNKGADFSYEELIMEVVGKRKYPIIYNYDCGHTHPMHTLPQMINIRLEALQNNVNITFLESAVDI
ncbi:S66 family peptidase [Fluviispira multicolorata]|uniref:LD-carboxypeptidase n=1 Tax=Fluviispira multicolorata TaxID=2654512 RepID=A0A833N4M1_9BACT|nr:S66 peptidase family protein [Fluviispira multicolorata]KAB8030951.1 LD-carboxypeptidase [Fluviispira multicolorata]